jgi:uncharacterized membrane protein
MIDEFDFWQLMRVVHLLGAVVWVGGMFFAILIMRPALASLDPPQRIDIYRAAFSRFFRVLWVVMPGMLLTGYLMLFGEFGGFAGAAWNIQMMHMLGLAMTAIFLGIWFRPYQRFRNGQGRAIEIIRPLIIANLVLGLITVALGALG